MYENKCTYPLIREYNSKQKSYQRAASFATFACLASLRETGHFALVDSPQSSNLTPPRLEADQRPGPPCASSNSMRHCQYWLKKNEAGMYMKIKGRLELLTRKAGMCMKTKVVIRKSGNLTQNKRVTRSLLPSWPIAPAWPTCGQQLCRRIAKRRRRSKAYGGAVGNCIRMQSGVSCR